MSDLKTYKATERGYVDGRIIEADQVFSTTAPKGEWMEPVRSKESEAARAVQEAQDPKPSDIDLEKVSGDALTAYALQFGINRGRLGDDKLRDAIRAAYDKDRTQ